uniref:Uncharacterized protein n=1 Tax=uncultured prokaryote TaxID=198431 RepID=A0A0H5PZ18_9ZZZZ|nr:hypothetical protein [uncultured prokaryote]
MLDAVSNAQGAISPFILEDVYDAFWVLYGGGVGNARRGAFESIFGVTHGGEDIEGEVIPVVFLDLTFWTPFWLWRFENPSPCPSPCYLTEWLNSH